MALIVIQNKATNAKIAQQVHIVLKRHLFQLCVQLALSVQLIQIHVSNAQQDSFALKVLQPILHLVVLERLAKVDKVFALFVQQVISALYNQQHPKYAMVDSIVLLVQVLALAAQLDISVLLDLCLQIHVQQGLTVRLSLQPVLSVRLATTVPKILKLQSNVLKATIVQ